MYGTGSLRVPLVLGVLLLVSSPGLLPTSSATGPSSTKAQRDPINHIVVLMMENHAYDNLFGTYCLTYNARTCHSTANGIPNGTCVPYDPLQPAKGCVRPWDFTATNYSSKDPVHGYNSSRQAVDNGKMDGFYKAENMGIVPFGHYNGSLLGFYWDLAEEYGLGDNFFSSALSYTLPNHWYLLAGRAPGIANTPGPLNYDTVAHMHQYLNQSNRTRTVQDLLNATPAVTWKYYDWALPTYANAIQINPAPGPYRSKEYTAYNYFNPLAARAESYTGWYVNHFTPRSQLFFDAASGNLPNVSWIMPSPGFSDHPPSDLRTGEQFVASVVDALESSPEWGTTALFVTWDDYGGFYDHQAPPVLDPLGLSFRVPLIVVSPFAKKNFVDHDLGYFESILAFIEDRFHLGCLTKRDCRAPSLLSYFNFHMAPRGPIQFAANETYPIPLQTLLRDPSVSWTPPPPNHWNSPPPASSIPEDAID